MRTLSRPIPRTSARPATARLLTALSALTLVFVFAAAGPARAASLHGSRASLLRQERMARHHDYSYLRSSSQVKRFAENGLLLRLGGNADYALASVSFPYARPEVKTFVERLGRQYRAACGEKLVVTSLTRPTSRQPYNASNLSVHPTGMAVDLRRSKRSACRSWLEKTLLSLERRDLVEATRERWPPHYHVALFSSPYRRYVAGLGGEVAGRPQVAASQRHKVRRGDTLWAIARRYGTSVAALQSANGVRARGLKPGQVLEIPAAAR
jgi:LysM repeat protein